MILELMILRLSSSCFFSAPRRGRSGSALLGDRDVLKAEEQNTVNMGLWNTDSSLVCYVSWKSTGGPVGEDRGRGRSYCRWALQLEWECVRTEGDIRALDRGRTIWRNLRNEDFQQYAPFIRKIRVNKSRRIYGRNTWDVSETWEIHTTLESVNICGRDQLGSFKLGVRRWMDSSGWG